MTIAPHVNPPWSPPWDEMVTRMHFPPGSFAAPVSPSPANEHGHGLAAAERRGQPDLPVTDADEGSTEFWRDVRKAVQTSKQDRLAQVQPFLEAPSSPFRQCSPSHWQARLQGDLLDYWPSTGRWRWRDKTHNGNYNALVGFMQARQAKT